MSEIEQVLAAMQARLSRLETDNAALRAEEAGLRGDRPPAQVSDLADLADDAGGRADVLESRPVSRRGMIAAVAGAAGGVLLAQATPAAAANGNNVVLGNNNTTGNVATSTTRIVNTSTTGSTGGLMADSATTLGFGLYGNSTASIGLTKGVYGAAASTSGTGVYGSATATTYGVYGHVASTSGFAVFAAGRFKATGRTYLGAPSTAPTDTDLNAGSVSLYLDQTNNALKVRVKYTTGTLKTATIALA